MKLSVQRQRLVACGEIKKICKEEVKSELGLFRGGMLEMERKRHSKQRGIVCRDLEMESLVQKRKMFLKIFVYLFRLHQVLVIAYRIFQLWQNPRDLVTNCSVPSSFLFEHLFHC